MSGNHRRQAVAYPDAPVGTCKHCGRSCASHRRQHDDCADQHRAANDYRQVATEREGAKQRCVDCRMVEGQTRKVPGDYPGGWKWERVEIQRDHPQRIADNGPRDWTVARCKRCHEAKTAEENRKTPTRRPSVRRPNRRTPHMPKTPALANLIRWLLAAALIATAVWWARNDMDLRDLADPSALTLPSMQRVGAWALRAALAALVVGALYWWARATSARRAETLMGLGDAIARETHTDPSRITIKVRRWRRGSPVVAKARYSTLFDDSEGSRGREAVESLLDRKIGCNLDIVWTPHRDTVAWSPAADTEPRQSAPAPDPEPERAPDRAAVIDRLHAGLTAAFGVDVDLAVSAWHAGNVPQSIRVGYPASARVHEDKVQDAVEDKVATLLPGTWRAEWRTNDDQVVFTDRPDPLAPIVNAPALPAHVDLRALPCGLSDSGKPWTVRLTQTHVLIGGASGAGKGSVLWSLIRALSPAVADGSVLLWAIDPKGGMELGRGKGAFGKFATDLDDALVLLDEAVSYMRTRAKRLAAAGSRKHEPRPGDPMLVVVIDEIATLTKYGADKATKDAVNAALGLLLSQGRAVGVCVVGALQDPRKDVLTMRDLFPTRIALRLNEANAPDMLLGAGARAAGARADRIAVEHAGMGYMMVDGQPTPERFRAAWIDDDAIDELVTRCRTARTAPAIEAPTGDPEPVQAVSLDDVEEGDRIVVDEDGVEHEVTVMAPPCPAAYDETVIEVDYRHDDGRVGCLALGEGEFVRRVTVATAH